MSKTINEFFGEQGYRLFSISTDMRFSIFVQEIAYSTNAICLINSSQAGPALRDSVAYFLNTQRSILERRGVLEIHFLTILVGAESNDLRMICLEHYDYWYYNTDRRSLEVGMNQMPDYYGIRIPFTEFTYVNGITLMRPVQQPQIQQAPVLPTPMNPMGRPMPQWQPIPGMQLRRRDQYTYTNTPQDGPVFGKKNFFPWETLILILINIAIYVLMVFTDAVPIEDWILDENILGDFSQCYRLFSYMFLHASLDHLLGNMVMLYIAGALAERYYGRIKYPLIYLLAGILGGGGSTIFYRLIGEPCGTVGASGAIMGVLGALIIMLLTNGQISQRRISVWRVIVVILFLIYINTPSGEGNINYACHVVGLLVGILLAFLFILITGVKKE